MPALPQQDAGAGEPQHKAPSAPLQVLAINVEEADDCRRVRRVLGDQRRRAAVHDLKVRS